MQNLQKAGMGSERASPLRHPLCIFHHTPAYMPQQCALLIMPINQYMQHPSGKRIDHTNNDRVLAAICTRQIAYMCVGKCH